MNFDTGAGERSPKDRGRDRRPRAITPLGLCAVGALLLPTAGLAVPTGTVDTQFVGATGQEAGYFPASPASGISSDYVFHATEGLFRTYDRAGNLLGSATWQNFWSSSGLDGPSGVSAPNGTAYNPRIVYDPASQRFFATQGWYTPSGTNDVQSSSLLLAVSRTSNPLDGFTGLRVAVGDGGSFAGLPTLGVSGDAVTLTTLTSPDLLQAAFSGTSVYSFAKADLLGASAASAEPTRFEGLSVTAAGFRLQPVSGSVTGSQAMLAVDDFAFGVLNRTDVVGTGAGASVVARPDIVGVYDGLPPSLRQPGPLNVQAELGDITSGLYQVGDFIYFTRTVGNANDGLATDPSTSYVAWGILRASTNEIVAEGLVGTPGRTNGYAAIAANADGRFVVSYNGSSETTALGAYAVVCDFDLVGSASCGPEILVKAGETTNYSQSITSLGVSRWGQYSAIQLDPLDPSAFWLTQTVPTTYGFSTQTDWMSVITRLVTSPTDGGGSTTPGGGGTTPGGGTPGTGGATEVPEPSTLSLAVLGLLGTWLRRRRRRAAQFATRRLPFAAASTPVS